MTTEAEVNTDNANGHRVEDVVAQVRAMPKIELHRHLEGSLRLETLVDLVGQGLVDIPANDIEQMRPLIQMMPGEERSRQHFFTKFHNIRQFFVSPEVIRRITREAVIDAANDNVKYLELRFTPKALTNLIDCTQHQAVQWVCETVAETVRDYDIQVNLIVSVNRHEGLDVAEEAAQAAVDYRHMGIVALDLGGNEPGHAAHPFRGLFKSVRQAGLALTLHAGEWEGPQSVWDAVSNFEVDRIGHGVRVLEDIGMVGVLLERDLVLEVCPSSNISTGVYDSLAAHPLPKLTELGLKVTINTDDPVVFGVNLSDELLRSIQHIGLTLDDVKRYTLAAAEAAFLPDAERARLVKQFQEYLA